MAGASNKVAAVGLDIGGQSIKAVAVDATGAVLGRASRDTGKATTADELGVALVGARNELCAPDQVGDTACGVGIAGVMGSDGTLEGCPNLPALIGLPFASLCSDALGVAVAVDNDANCAALAESWNGAAADTDDFLLLTLGSGLGSGLVLGGRVHHGATGHGCEFGHAVVVRGGRLCGCGNRGCLEAYVSESAARSMVEDASADLQAAVALVTAKKPGFARALFELQEGGSSKEAQALVAEIIACLGTGIATAVNSFDVELIVLGGGIAPAVLARSGELQDSVAASLFARGASRVRIVQAVHGPLAGAIGAARLALTP